MNYKVLAVGLVVVVPTLALFWQAFGTDPHALPSALEGKAAPSFELTSIQGDKIAFTSLRGKPFVLNFWATWCGPCVQEHPALLAVSRKYGQDVAFYGVLYGDEKYKAEAFLQQHGQSFPTLLDPTGRTAIDYGVAGVPETFVVSKEGQIVQKFVGPIDPNAMAAVLDQIR